MREILSGALGTFAFSVLMQVPRRLLFFTTFGGLLSGTVYRFAEENGMGAFGATLWGMLAVALYAELLARVLKTALLGTCAPQCRFEMLSLYKSEKLAPERPHDQYDLNDTGEDNADAHLKRSVMGREVVVAVTAGQLDFGPWEQIFYGEFDGLRRKRVLVKIIGA